MNLIKELLVLKEEDTSMKVPSFGDMQKAIYKVALPYFLKAQKTKDLGDLTLSTLQSEAENDRFWTSSFDFAYSTLKKFGQGEKDLDDVVDALGETFDVVVGQIYDHYSDRWNFAPNTKLPKLVRADEVDGDVLTQLVFDMVPGAKEQADSEAEHRGVVNAMHKDFSKLANQQRVGKTGKNAVATWVEAARQVLPQLIKGGGEIANVYFTSDTMEAVVRLDDEDYVLIPNAKQIDKSDLKLPSQISSVDVEEDSEAHSFTFHFKDEIPRPLRDLVDDEVRKIRRALLK